MKSVHVFLLRLAISGALAFFIFRLFFHETSFVKISGLALIMICLAYLFEYTRKRDKGE